MFKPASASRFYERFIGEKRSEDPCRKNDISGSIWPRIVYQSFYGASFVFSYFLFQEKVLCFSPRRQVAYEMFISVKRSEDPCRKNHISSSIWPKSFIQMVKYSFFSQRIVYQSFYGASFVFNYFLIQGKGLCFSPCRQVAYEMFISVKRSEDPCRKNHISCSIWPKLFIQTVKYSFFSQRIVYQSFFEASLSFS